MPEDRSTSQGGSAFPTFVWGIFVFCLFWLLAVMVFKFSAPVETVEQKRANARIEKRRALDESHRALLTTYAWVDKEKGVVQIPVDRAMVVAIDKLKQKPVRATDVKVQLPGATPAPAAAPGAPTPAPAPTAPPKPTPATPTPAAPAPTPAPVPPAAPNTPAPAPPQPKPATEPAAPAVEAPKAAPPATEVPAPKPQPAAPPAEAVAKPAAEPAPSTEPAPANPTPNAPK